MLRCTGLYPNKEGAKFDFDYYLAKHIPRRTRFRAVGSR